MAKKQTDFTFDIHEKIKVYHDGLEKIQQLVAVKSFDSAVMIAIQTIVLACTGEMPLTNSIQELFEYCIVLIPDVSIFVSPHLSDPELANRLEGILRERKAYYIQLENLHTSI